MKVALVHEWLDSYAGSERVVEQMLACFPEADLYALCDFLPDNQRGFLGGKIPKTSFIQRLPFAKKMFRNYLQLMPLAIEQFDLQGYDLVVSSSHAVAKGVITGPAGGADSAKFAVQSVAGVSALVVAGSAALTLTGSAAGNGAYVIGTVTSTP